MVAPPLLAGAVHETRAEVVEATDAVTDVGAPGALAISMGADSADHAPVPSALTAATSTMYVAPLVSPVSIPVVAVEPGDQVAQDPPEFIEYRSV
jgi:hypothetical protein